MDRVIGIRLRPPGAWALLAHPLSELSDLTLDLRDLLGNAAAELAERCHASASGVQRVSLVAAWLTERLHSPAVRPADPAVRWAAACIAGTAGDTPVAWLKSRTGLSGTRMSAIFREQVGLTPKRYARIHRFRRALTLLQDGRSALAEVALLAGYYDQPHMNADFRVLAGMTPREFLRATHYPGSVSLAEAA